MRLGARFPLVAIAADRLEVRRIVRAALRLVHLVVNHACRPQPTGPLAGLTHAMIPREDRFAQLVPARTVATLVPIASLLIVLPTDRLTLVLFAVAGLIEQPAAAVMTAGRRRFLGHTTILDQPPTDGGHMTRDELLREQTNKDPDLEVGRRVYYTLASTKTGAAAKPVDPIAHRTAMLVSLLVDKLTREGKLNEAELDEMLLQIIR